MESQHRLTFSLVANDSLKLESRSNNMREAISRPSYAKLKYLPTLQTYRSYRPATSLRVSSIRVLYKAFRRC